MIFTFSINNCEGIIMKYDLIRIRKLISDLKIIQDFFSKNFGVQDIFSNSKFYEIIIANYFKHIPIPGHSGSRDARDLAGNEYEYKHYKQTSSNHTWTFNDFSENLINHMHEYTFIFGHIDDENYSYPGIIDWYYRVPGIIMEKYLSIATERITNKRKMINVSPGQLESLGMKREQTLTVNASKYEGLFKAQLLRISEISEELEKLTGVTKILTSNKLYELLVALELNHKVNPENGGREGAHDAEDDLGRTYEYKVYKNENWNFQDISDAVLNKYLLDERIILALVDKEALKVLKIYSVSPKDAVPVLKRKIMMKIERANRGGTEVRRLQTTLSLNEIRTMSSFQVLK